MAENGPDDGWEVVTSKKRKPSTAKSDQAGTPTKSSESGPKTSASSTWDPKSPTSTASTPKRRATDSKANSKFHDNSSHNKPKGEGTGVSELLPTSGSTLSAQGISIASPEAISKPAFEIPDLSQQTLAVASTGRPSPTKSHSSSEFASYVTAQPSQAPDICSSSSESYDSADEGEVSLDHSVHLPKPSLWTPIPKRGSSSDPRSQVMSQVQESTDKTIEQENTHIQENKVESRIANASSSKDPALNKEGNKSIQTSSKEHEIAELEVGSTQSGSESVIPQSSAERTIWSPPPNPGSFSPIFTDISDDPHQMTVIHQSKEVPQASPIPSHHEEAVVKEDAKLVVEGSPGAVVNHNTESLGNTTEKITAHKRQQLSSPTSIHQDSVPSSSTHHELRRVSAPSTSVDLQTTSRPSRVIAPEFTAPSSSPDHDPGRVSTPSTSVDPETALRPSSAITRETLAPSFAANQDIRRPSGSSTLSDPQTSLTPSTITSYEDYPFLSSIHLKLGRLPSPSTTAPHKLPANIALLISAPQKVASVKAEYSPSIVSASTTKMAPDPEKTKSGSTSVQPEQGDDEKTPKPKFAQLVSDLDQAVTLPIRPPQAPFSLIRRENSEFSSFHRATVSAESPSTPENLTREQGAAIRPRLDATEQALTGFEIVPATSRSGPSRAGAQVAQPPSPSPHSSPSPRRRSHAIPIRAPLPAPGFGRPLSVVPEYDHGLRGVPSHYIPMQGAMHGMFFDPATEMFVGDGPPRATPERPDGSLPGTRRVQAAAAPISNRPVSPDDALHVQTEEHIASTNAAGERAAAAPPVLLPVGVAPAFAPTPPFQRYFCQCTGQWLDRQHACPEPTPTQLPSGMPMMPGMELGPEWMTHRVVVDASIYPGGVVPAPGSAAAAATSAVGGLEDLPAHWFLPASAATTVGGPPTELGGSSTVAGGDGGGPAEGEANKNKKKKRRSGVRHKKKGGVTAAEDEGKGKGKEEEGGEEGGKEGGSGQVVAAA